MPALRILVLWLAASPASQQATERPRAFHEIDKDLRAILQRESRAATPQARAVAVCEMMLLCEEIRRHPRWSTSETLQQYKVRLCSRLAAVRDEIQRQMARDRKRRARPQGQPAPQTADQGRPAQPPSSGGGPGDAVSQEVVLGGRAGPADWGDSLVELIERTIAPEFWDVHGGPGTIVYYQPLRALVVRATSDVHHGVGRLLRDLREVRR